MTDSKMPDDMKVLDNANWPEHLHIAIAGNRYVVVDGEGTKPEIVRKYCADNNALTKAVELARDLMTAYRAEFAARELDKSSFIIRAERELKEIEASNG